MPDKEEVATSTTVVNAATAAASAKSIEKYLREERKAWNLQQMEPKVLILGSADSGKSTLLKQLKLLHGGGFSDQEKCLAANRIRYSIFDAISIMISNFKGPTTSALQLKYAPLILYQKKKWEVSHEIVDKEISDLVMEAWSEKDYKTFFSESPSLFLDTIEYFLQDIPRFFDDSFIPSNVDILNLRVPTQAVSDTVIKVGKNSYHFFDVSGLVKHRKVWMQYFDKVDSILFVISLASYNQVLVEDPTVNRMVDAIVLFHTIGNHPLLKKVSFMLFMNKRDLYEKKAKKIDITEFFPEYSGKKLSVSSGASFFKEKLLSQCPKTNIAATHFTMATDTQAMQVIIDGVLSSILAVNLQHAGMTSAE